MLTRTLGKDLSVFPIGLGCMGMSEFYGPRHDEQALQVLQSAAELGIDFFDTADTYGPEHNERLLGRFLQQHPTTLKVATKFGIVRQTGQYERTLNNSPAYLRQACEQSLRRLQRERIDLYYVHRVAPQTPIEDTVSAMAELVQEGKVAHLGLCEVNAQTLRRAHAVHPITALQTEYSLWSRDIEAEILPICRELGISLVPYSPLGRGFLTGRFTTKNQFSEGDFRAQLPRFQAEYRAHNLALVELIKELAIKKACSPAQLALAWVLAQGKDIVPIPGTTNPAHLIENLAALSVQFTPEELQTLNEKLSQITVLGERYTLEGMKGLNA